VIPYPSTRSNVDLLRIKQRKRKPLCEERRNRIPEKVGSRLDSGKIGIRKRERKYKEWLRR